MAIQEFQLNPNSDTLAVALAIQKPLPGVANNVAANAIPAPFSLVGKTLRAAARSNLGTTVTFALTLNGATKGFVSINAGATFGSSNPNDFNVSEGDVLDADIISGGTDDIAVTVFIVGEHV